MPASPAEQLENLARLRSAHAPCCAPPAGHEAAARSAARKMPLSHSTDEKAFELILNVGALLSCEARRAEPRDVYFKLGSANDVFLYLGSASFPQKEMAFIFKASLTEDHRGQAVATPFDSGGCMGRFPLPAGADGVTFVRQHEMPVPECREYLGDLLARCYQSVEGYLVGESFACPVCGVPVADPHGLSPARQSDYGLDRLHEVRVAEKVDCNVQLAAVLVPKGMATPRLAKLRRAGVHVAEYPRPVDPVPHQTHALRNAATALILDKYLI